MFECVYTFLRTEPTVGFWFGPSHFYPDVLVVLCACTFVGLYIVMNQELESSAKLPTVYGDNGKVGTGLINGLLLPLHVFVGAWVDVSQPRRKLDPSNKSI